MMVSAEADGVADGVLVPPAVLHGLDLESEHCMFENQNGTVTLVPLAGAQCSVNGVQVTEPLQLNQGEGRLLLPAFLGASVGRL